MSGFNGSGTFQISGAGLPYVSGTTISSAVVNQLNSDFATGLTNCITKDGQQVITANIGWNNHNINNLSALGIGTASPSGQMQVVSGATTNFIINSSGNVGIGTNTPASKLDVIGTISASGYQAAKYTMYGYGSYGSIQIGVPNSINGTVALGVDVSTIAGGSFKGQNQIIIPSNGVLFPNAAGTDFIGAIARNSSNSILLGPSMASGLLTGDMVIDTSGNVGIGTNSPSYSLDINGSVAAIRVAPSTGTNNALTRYVNTGGTFFVGLDSSSAGLAGAYTANLWHSGNYAMAFATNNTERMRIDSSGNVGIGTTSPSSLGKFVVANNFWVSTSATNYCANIVGSPLGSTLGSNAKQLQISATTALNNPTQLAIDFYRYAAGSDGYAVTTKIQHKAYISSTTYNLGYIYFNPDATGYDGISFGAAGSETMRIISNAAYSAPALLIGYTSSNGAYKLQVNSQIFATSSTIATSDGNYKENVNTLENALDLVCALNPVSFNWKEHTVHNFDRTSTTTGFIAQEVKEVLKDTAYVNAIVKTNTCVLEQEEKDEDGNVTKPAVTEEFLGIAEGNLIAILTKAIQELKTELDAVKSELAALKGS